MIQNTEMGWYVIYNEVKPIGHFNDTTIYETNLQHKVYSNRYK